MNTPILTIILRFSIVFLMALLFGIQRQRAHKPIGFGTFIFVSIGSCALALTAINIYPESPLPLLAAIVTGIGFLGAGALIKTTDKIFGFTSAASIWLFAIVGLVIGVGEYFIGTAVYILVWLVLVYDDYLEKRGIGSYQRRIVVNTSKIISKKEIESVLLLLTKKFKLMSMEVDKKENKMAITYLIEGSKDALNKIAKIFYDKEWFESFKVE